MNELALVQKDGEDDTADGDAEDMWKEAEEVAINLWNEIALGWFVSVYPRSRTRTLEG